jgi:hypothetical protein
MKKKWIIPVILLVAAALIAAIVRAQPPEDPTETSDPSKEIYTSVGRCLISDNGAYLLIQQFDATVLYGKEGLFEGIDTGDEIEVKHGMVQTTYPGGTNAYEVKKLSDGSIDDIPQDVIDDLTELGWVNTADNPVLGLDYNTVSWVNWSDDERIYSCALNREKVSAGSTQHFPVYKVDTAEEFVDFKKSFGEILSLDSSYDEFPSFEEVTAQYGEAFFEKYALIIAYVTSGSGSDRFGQGGYELDESGLRFHIIKTNNPEVGTCDMAGWFLTIYVKDEEIEDCPQFDAFLSRTFN